MKKILCFFSLISMFIPFLANAECLISFPVRQICPLKISGTDVLCAESSVIALQETSGTYFCAPNDTFSRCVLTPTGFGLECGAISQKEECDTLTYCHWKS